jgi:tetratricopeptide (TPR) repeat protein
MGGIGLLGSTVPIEVAMLMMVMAAIYLWVLFVFTRIEAKEDEAKIFMTKAGQLIKDGEWDEALAEYRMAANIIDDRTDPKVMGDCYHGIGYCLYQLGKQRSDPELFIGSNTMNEKAWKIYAKDGLGYEATVCLSHIGNSLVKLSQYDRAEKHLTTAIKMYHAALSLKIEAQIREVEWGNWLGAGNGDPHEIEFDEDREIEEMLGGKYPVEHGNILNNLGSAYRQLSRISDSEENLTKAISNYNKALKIRSLERFPEDHAITMVNLGNTHIDLFRLRKDPEDLTIGAHEFMQALAVYTEEDHPDMHRSLTKRRDHVLKKLVALQVVG